MTIKHFKLHSQKKYFITMGDNVPPVIKSEKVTPVDNHLRQMSEQFGNILGDMKFSDVKIVAGNDEFHCHRNILSGRSPVFEAMFQSDMIENTSRIVDMKDIKPEVVREMLHYIYTGVISNDDVIDEIGGDLLRAADQYQLNLLKNNCEEMLCSSLKVSNSIERLVLADLHQASKLRRMALRLVTKNMDTFMERVNPDICHAFKYILVPNKAHFQ